MDLPIYQDENLTIIHYELLSKKTLKTVDKENAIVVIPVGLMEVHGDFLPLGTDFIESIGWAKPLVEEALKERRKDKKYTIVHFPPIPLGTGSGERGMLGTVCLSRQAFRKVMMQVVEALIFSGFKKFLLLTAHHGNTHAYVLEEVVHAKMKKHKDVKIASPVNFFVKRAYVDKNIEFWNEIAAAVGEPPLNEQDFHDARNDHHSALMETSFMKTVNESWVDPMYKECGEHLTGIGHTIKSLLARRWANLGGIDGCAYNGNPSRVDSRNWILLYEEIIKRLTVEMVDALLDDPPGKFRFRDSFMWKLSFLKTNLKWYFIGPLLAFLFIFPWISLFLPTGPREIFQFWAIIAYLIQLLGVFLYFFGPIYFRIKALGQESQKK